MNSRTRAVPTYLEGSEIVVARSINEVVRVNATGILDLKSGCPHTAIWFAKHPDAPQAPNS